MLSPLVNLKLVANAENIFRFHSTLFDMRNSCIHFCFDSTAGSDSKFHFVWWKNLNMQKLINMRMNVEVFSFYFFIFFFFCNLVIRIGSKSLSINVVCIESCQIHIINKIYTFEHKLYVFLIRSPNKKTQLFD